MSKLLNYKKALLDELTKQYPGRKISFDTLRLEKALSKSNNIVFPLLDSDQALAALTERRLKAGELFVPFAISLQHYKRATNVLGSEIFATLQTFVDKAIYTDPNATTFDPNHLEAIYNAELSFTRNRNVEIPAIYTRKFKFIPTQQTTAAFQSEIDSEAGYAEILGTKVMEGNGQNEWRLDALNADYNWQYPAAENQEIRLALLLEGFRII